MNLKLEQKIRTLAEDEGFAYLFMESSKILAAFFFIGGVVIHTDRNASHMLLIAADPYSDLPRNSYCRNPSAAGSPLIDGFVIDPSLFTWGL